MMMLVLLIIFMAVRAAHGVCIQEERKALLEIKASLHDDVDHHRLLPTWVDSECCNWERIKCNTTTGRVTDLSLSNINNNENHIWPLNVSFFLHFKELRSLDLSYNYIDDTIVNTGFDKLSSLKKLEILNLSNNDIEIEIFPSLGALTWLKVLDLSYNNMWKGYHDISQFATLENLEVLDLSDGGYYGTFQFQDSQRDSILKNLRILNLGRNYFNKSLITSLRSLSSLKALDLSANSLSGLFPAQELLSLRNLEVLHLSGNNFDGTLPMEALASLRNLEVLDLSQNNFVGSIPSTIQLLSSLRVVSFAVNSLNGSLPSHHGLCDLINLQELVLRGNMFDGNLPQCFNKLSSLKLFDISSNQFTGTLPSYLIANLTSLEYVDFSHNQFEGSFSFSSFSNLTKLEAVRFVDENSKFELETEDPVGWIPMFQLKVLVLPNCNINRHKGSVIPSFLLHQRELIELEMPHNSLKGQFPNWLIENNTMLEYLLLRNNSIGGSISMPSYLNGNTRVLDMSGNFLNGTIPRDIQKKLPKLFYLDFSNNSINGAIPSSFGNFSELDLLDLSHNQLSGEVPKGLFTNLPYLRTLKLSNNRLQGEVLSGNISLGKMRSLHLDSNGFTGKIGNVTTLVSKLKLEVLDISNNSLRGMIPSWISNIGSYFVLVVRNNSLEGQFPCGTTPFLFLDISENSFSGPIPSAACLNLSYVKHLHLGSNRFSGSIPTSFRSLTNVLTLELQNNSLSGRIPTFLGYLSNLRILLLGKNYFVGSIPNQLCQLNRVSLIDLSSNSLSGTIPSCLHNIAAAPHDRAFNIVSVRYEGKFTSNYWYRSVVHDLYVIIFFYYKDDTQDEARFTTKSMSYLYKGKILDYMAGLDLSCNKLKGEIPPQLGMLTQILSLNLSHNQLTGPIPVNLSNLSKIESLDLSSNCLSGHVPSELLKLNYLAVLNVSHNNLSGRLPEMKAQFSTFDKDSYEENPSLCGPPLDNKCKITSHITYPLTEEGSDGKWYDIDMSSFYSAWFIFLLGFATTLYINPYLRRRWLDLIEECMYTCYYFFCDSVRNLSTLFCK